MWNLGSYFSGIVGNNSPESSTFRSEYECYPGSFAGKECMERGNKILLPPSALHSLARMNIAWPMLFKATNVNTRKYTHVGVLEFVAEEGLCYIPYWVMQNLELTESSLVEIENVQIPKGTWSRLQPATSEFLELSNPRALLENALRHHAALTKGDKICLHHLDQVYHIFVKELEPAAAVTIIETDVTVEFDAPLDDCQNAQLTGSNTPRESACTRTSGSRIDGKSIKTRSGEAISGNDEASNAAEPWLHKLPRGVRRHNAEYARAVQEGRTSRFCQRTTGIN